MSGIHTSATDRPSYAELRNEYAEDIENMAAVLAEEDGTHIWLCTPDERARYLALATRAVEEALESDYGGRLEALKERLEDSEARNEEALQALAALRDTIHDDFERVITNLKSDENS